MAVVPSSPFSIRFRGHFCLLPKYACFPSYSLFHRPVRSFSSTSPQLRQIVRASSAVTLETETQTRSEEGSEIDLFACPVCYEPLVRKGPSGCNLAAIYRSGFKCRKCNKTYSSKNIYLDLTVTAGSKDYNEFRPGGTELFRLIADEWLVSFIYHLKPFKGSSNASLLVA